MPITQPPTMSTEVAGKAKQADEQSNTEPFDVPPTASIAGAHLGDLSRPAPEPDNRKARDKAEIERTPGGRSVPSDDIDEPQLDTHKMTKKPDELRSAEVLNDPDNLNNQ
jgi:hypothetical protein